MPPTMRTALLWFWSAAGNATDDGSLRVVTSNAHFSEKSSMDQAWIVCFDRTPPAEAAVAESNTMTRLATSMAGVPVIPSVGMLENLQPVDPAGGPAGAGGIAFAPVVSSSA